MSGLFDRNRPDPTAVRRIKMLIAERFALTESSTLAVAELRCHEPDCPPVETVITALETDGSMRDWRIAKPLSDVDRADIEMLSEQP
ncbi:MAG: hypothetical protein OXE84_02415 [Rhodobacteraceae bacterium]|nr:hypothetical protein [Paracoccaceae bacterium]MCY4195865.1 hypothetical protein [Paracoccaceae bacterium]MCY4327865.1 hypothetical protein [Paracoccaceae bacterium]